MMHGMGMGGFVLSFPLFGLLTLILLGGGTYILLRKLRTVDRSRRESMFGRHTPGIPGGHGAPAPEVFRLAKRYGGILTVSDVVSELSAGPKEAEELLEGLTDGRRVDMQVDQNGVVQYVFREFTT